MFMPPGDRQTSIRTTEAEFLCAFLRERRITRTLEVGFAYGYSAASIISATASKHVVIDPHPERYQDLGAKNLAALGFADLYELRKASSHVALPALVQEGRMFQFIFIDGGHKFDQIFVDWYYSDLLLENGGYVVFHDSWMRSTQVVTEFVRTNRSNYKEVSIPLKSLVVFEKIAESDNRTWDHFREFNTPSLSRLYSNAHNRLKRALARIKRHLAARAGGRQEHPDSSLRT